MKDTANSSLRADAEKLSDMFTLLQRGFVLKLSKELVRGNVSFPQYLLLSFLAQEKDAPTMSEVAAKMQHTTAAATGLVGRLEKLGLARRQTATKDRRKVFVHITQKGIELVTRVREDMVENLMQLMTHLNENEQRTWVRIYEKIVPHTPR